MAPGESGKPATVSRLSLAFVEYDVRKQLSALGIDKYTEEIVQRYSLVMKVHTVCRVNRRTLVLVCSYYIYREHEDYGLSFELICEQYNVPKSDVTSIVRFYNMQTSKSSTASNSHMMVNMKEVIARYCEKTDMKKEYESICRNLGEIERVFNVYSYSTPRSIAIALIYISMRNRDSRSVRKLLNFRVGHSIINSIIDKIKLLKENHGIAVDMDSVPPIDVSLISRRASNVLKIVDSKRMR